MEKIYSVQFYGSSIFLPVSALAKMFGCSGQTVRRNLKEIQEHERYKNAWIDFGADGTPSYNLLVYVDYMHYRPRLRNKNLAKGLPPFSESEVRKRIGDFGLIREA